MKAGQPSRFVPTPRADVFLHDGAELSRQPAHRKELILEALLFLLVLLSRGWEYTKNCEDLTPFSLPTAELLSTNLFSLHLINSYRAKAPQTLK